jgi:hypothetical protein
MTNNSRIFQVAGLFLAPASEGFSAALQLHHEKLLALLGNLGSKFVRIIVLPTAKIYNRLLFSFEAEFSAIWQHRQRSSFSAVALLRSYLPSIRDNDIWIRNNTT